MTLLSPQHDMKAGLYKIVFETKVYFESSGRQSFYPWVEVCDIRISKFISAHTGTLIDHLRRYQHR